MKETIAADVSFSNMVEDDFYGDVHVCAYDCMGLIGGSVICDMLVIQ